MKRFLWIVAIWIGILAGLWASMGAVYFSWAASFEKQPLSLENHNEGEGRYEVLMANRNWALGMAAGFFSLAILSFSKVQSQIQKRNRERYGEVPVSVKQAYSMIESKLQPTFKSLGCVPGQLKIDEDEPESQATNYEGPSASFRLEWTHLDGAFVLSYRTGLAKDLGCWESVILRKYDRSSTGRGEVDQLALEIMAELSVFLQEMEGK